MKKGRVVEVDYDKFLVARNSAKRAETAIFPLDKKRWSEAIRERDIREKAFRLIAEERYQATEFVILSGDEPWDGIFAADPDSRTCIRFEIATLE